MVSAKTTVINPQGMHMRPAQVFVGEMSKFKCDINILFNGKVINGKSIMNLMASLIKKDSEIEIQCSGEDENEALAKAIALVEAGLGDL